METPQNSRSTVGLAIGVGLVALGSWWFLRDSGLVPPGIFDFIGRISWPIAIIIVGIALIYVARRGHAPAPGARFLRSRSDRWVAGVLGGLGPFLGIDPIVLRIAFIVLAVTGAGSFVLILAYIVAAVIVPEEPAAPIPVA